MNSHPIKAQGGKNKMSTQKKKGSNEARGESTAIKSACKESFHVRALMVAIHDTAAQSDK